LQRGQRQRVQFWTYQAESDAFDQDLAIESRNAALRSDEAQDQEMSSKITTPLAIESSTDVSQRAESRSDDPEESEVDHSSSSRFNELTTLSSDLWRADFSDVTEASATDSPVTDPARQLDDVQVTALALNEHPDNISVTEAAIGPVEMEISPIPPPMAADQVNSEHSADVREFLKENALTDSDDINSSVKAEQIAEVTHTTDIPESATEMNQPAVAAKVTEPCVTIVKFYVNADGQKVFLTPSMDQQREAANTQIDTDESPKSTDIPDQSDPTTVRPSAELETATEVSPAVESDPVTENSAADAPVPEPITENISSESVKSIQLDVESAVSDVNEEPSADTSDPNELQVSEPKPAKSFPPIESEDVEMASTLSPLTHDLSSEMKNTEPLSDTVDDAEADGTKIPDPSIQESAADAPSIDASPVDDKEAPNSDSVEPATAHPLADEDFIQIDLNEPTEVPQLQDEAKQPAFDPEEDTTEIPSDFEVQKQNVDLEEGAASKADASESHPADSTEIPPSDSTEPSASTEAESQPTEQPASDENDFLSREDLLISRIRNIVDSLSKPRDSLFFKRTSGFLHTVGSVFRRPRRQIRPDPFFVIQAPDLSGTKRQVTPEQEDVYQSFLRNVKGQEPVGDSIITGKPVNAFNQARDSGTVDINVSGYLPFQSPNYRPGTAIDDVGAQRVRRSDPSLLQFIYSRPLPLRRALSTDPRTAKTILSQKSPTECDLHIKVFSFDDFFLNLYLIFII
jgi:hypothetical protein